MRTNLTKSNSKLQELNNTNQYVDRKLENLTYLLFNEQAWADFLNKITALAKQYNINVIKLTNSVQDVSVREVKEAVTIELQFNGSFKHILQFINAIEESRMIIDIYELNLIQKETLEGDLKIAIWGMRY